MEACAVVVRFVLYVAVLGLFGAAGLGLYAPAAFALARPRRAMIAAAGAALAATLVGLGVLTAQMTGAAADALDPGAVTAVATGTGAGLAILTRTAVLAAVLAILARGTQGRATPGAALAGLGAIAAASLAWGGHAAGSEGALAVLRLGADILHLLAAGVWLGALAAFLRLIGSGQPQDIGEIQASLVRFAGVGSGVVAVLLLTGVINLALTLGLSRLTTLTETPWGWMLLLKLVLFAVMLALAALNRFRLAPALVLPGRGRDLRRSLALETLCAVLVMGLVAWLGRLSPLPDG